MPASYEDKKVIYDLTDFPNHKFDLGALQYQIEHSLVKTSIDYEAGLGGSASGGCSINFKEVLPSDDRSALDAVVAAHPGTPLPAPPSDVKIVNTDSMGNIPTAVQPRSGSGLTIMTHNFADPKSWYSNSVRVADKTLAPTAAEVYDSYDFGDEVVDLENGRVTFEGTIVNTQHNGESYIPKIKVNGTTVTSGYHIDYATNRVIFNAALSADDVVTATYYRVNDSTFTIAPLPGRQIIMEHVETQFSTNVDFTNKELWFDVWATNPQDPTGPKIRVKSPVRYKCVKDFLNESNNSLSTLVPQMGELTKSVYIFAWKYPAARILKSSQGAEIRIFIFDKTNGSKSNLYASLDSAPIDIATGTFYCLSEPE